MYIKYGHCPLIHGDSVFLSHNRRAMYIKGEWTMFYIYHALKGVFVAFCSDIWMRFCQSWPFCTKMTGDIRSLHQKKIIAFFHLLWHLNQFWAKKFLLKNLIFQDCHNTMILHLYVHWKGMINRAVVWRCDEEICVLENKDMISISSHHQKSWISWALIAFKSVWTCNLIYRSIFQVIYYLVLLWYHPSKFSDLYDCQ